MIRPIRKRFVTAVVAMAFLGTGSIALAQDPIFELLKYLLKPVIDQHKRNMKFDAFIEKSQYAIVISKNNFQPWSFGYEADRKSDLSLKQSGTVTVSEYDSIRDTYSTPVALNPGDRPVAIGNYMVITPVVAKTGLVTWEKFFRVCYLQDDKGNKIYLNITKDTPSAAIPTVGIAMESNKMVMENKALQFSDRQRKNLNMIAVAVDRLP